MRLLERGIPWCNKAELYIGIIKEAVRRDMREADSPIKLWDYCFERRVQINNLTVKPRFNLHKTYPYTQLKNEEGDISNLCQYRWYDWVYFREKSAKFPHGQELLGIVLGLSKDSGNKMSQCILKSNGRVVSRRTFRPLRKEEIHSLVEDKKREIFNTLIRKKLEK